MKVFFEYTTVVAVEKEIPDKFSPLAKDIPDYYKSPEERKEWNILWDEFLETVDPIWDEIESNDPEFREATGIYPEGPTGCFIEY